LRISDDDDDDDDPKQQRKGVLCVETMTAQQPLPTVSTAEYLQVIGHVLHRVRFCDSDDVGGLFFVVLFRRTFSRSRACIAIA
jgi:hypothetical protein